jgi:hypothetical protein
MAYPPPPTGPAAHEPEFGAAYGRKESVGNPLGKPPQPRPPRRRLGWLEVSLLIAMVVGCLAAIVLVSR